AERQRAAGEQAAEKRADAVAETRLQDVERVQADAGAAEREAADEQARLQREAQAAETEAAQLRAETEK
ncbi:MAG: hypothetical protein JWR42_1076, partial [Marmoricola sp.]|nr:hypothetical protein [Marmoricola sp.]